jgi:hypothetical protein
VDTRDDIVLREIKSFVDESAALTWAMMKDVRN